MASAVVAGGASAMLLGLVQEQAKSRSITTCKWQTTNSFGTKWPRLSGLVEEKAWLTANFYVSRDTWAMFHGFARAQLVRFKWALSAVILLAFWA